MALNLNKNNSDLSRRIDDLTQALQTQVDFYKVENSNLMGEVTNLISDNSKLSNQVENLLKDQNCFCEANSNSCMKSQFEDLKGQLILTLREKESLTKLWQNAERTVQSLENELKEYHFSSGAQVDVDKVKKQFGQMMQSMETKLSEVSTDLMLSQDKLSKKDNVISALETKLKEKDVCISIYDKKLNDAESTMNSLEHDIVVLKNDLSTEKRNHEEVLSYVDMCRRNMEIYVRREAECKIKISEALALVDAAIVERDQSLKREKEAFDETRQLSGKVTSMLNESNIRIQREIDIAKMSYDEKLNDMLIHIQRMELELGDKNLLLERAIRECKLLEGELEKYRKCKENLTDDNLSKLLLLEQKLESTFQQLILSERKIIQVTSEKESLQMEVEQITNGYQRDLRKREWEQNMYLNEINCLRARIEDLKRSFVEIQSRLKANQVDWSARERRDKTLIEEKNSCIADLERHMEKRQSLNDRWKEDTKKIIEKLQIRLKEMHKENWILRKSTEKPKNTTNTDTKANFKIN